MLLAKLFDSEGMNAAAASSKTAVSDKSTGVSATSRSNSTRKRFGSMIAALFPAFVSAAETEFTTHRTWLHLNGYSVHFHAADANDRLYGIGFTHYRRLQGRIIPAWEVDVFDDSARELSAYVGHSWTVPARFISVGVTGAVMYHRNFEAQNDLKLLPVALPFIESHGRRFKVRMYYVPPVRSKADHQIAFQVTIPLWR